MDEWMDVMYVYMHTYRYTFDAPWGLRKAQASARAGLFVSSRMSLVVSPGGRVGRGKARRQNTQAAIVGSGPRGPMTHLPPPPVRPYKSKREQQLGRGGAHHAGQTVHLAEM